MARKHSPLNQLIVDQKDLSMFPIVRVNEGTAKYWQVTDLRPGSSYGSMRRYRTRLQAEEAICSVVRRSVAAV